MRADKVAVIGVPMDLGGGRRGVDMGPSAMRIAQLREQVEALGLPCSDHGNVHVEEAEAAACGSARARFLEEIAATCARLRVRVEDALRGGWLPLVIGGDHSIAAGTVAGISSFHHERGERIGLIWFDAHADMNTPESSPSGNVHGMPLAACMGRGAPELTGLGAITPMVDPRNVALVGLRSVDQHERELVHESGIKAFTMREIDMRGMHAVMHDAIEVALRGTAGFHLSFDLDGTDPSVAPGVGTPVAGGTTLRESYLVMEHAHDSGGLLGLEITELNPILDDRNRTAERAVDLVLSALGKSVL